MPRPPAESPITSSLTNITCREEFMICDLRFAICRSRGNEALIKKRNWKLLTSSPTHQKLKTKILLVVIISSFCLPPSAFCFEGSIHAAMTRGSQSDVLLYTVGTNFLRVEMTATNWPNPVDILDRNSGELTLLFPNNRSYVHLKSATDAVTAPTPGVPGML